MLLMFESRKWEQVGGLVVPSLIRETAQLKDCVSHIAYCTLHTAHNAYSTLQTIFCTLLTAHCTFSSYCSLYRINKTETMVTLAWMRCLLVVCNDQHQHDDDQGIAMGSLSQDSQLAESLCTLLKSNCNCSVSYQCMQRHKSLLQCCELTLQQPGVSNS